MRIDTVIEPEETRAVALLLHGGQESSREPVRNRHASWWRMEWLGRSLRTFAEREHVAVLLVQYRYRGWNDPADPDPVADARRALDEIDERFPDRPVVLVGHSMGGRTACRVADGASVVGVVGLAPWLPEGEPVDAVTDRHLSVLHGTRDAWTKADASRRYVERATAVAHSARWESLPGAGHFMFRSMRRWRAFVETSIAESLSPEPSAERPPPDRSPPR